MNKPKLLYLNDVVIESIYDIKDLYDRAEKNSIFIVPKKDIYSDDNSVVLQENEAIRVDEIDIENGVVYVRDDHFCLFHIFENCDFKHKTNP